MGITLKSIANVMLHGRIIGAGEVFTCDTAFARKLIQGGSAQVFKGEEGPPEQTAPPGEKEPPEQTEPPNVVVHPSQESAEQASEERLKKIAAFESKKRDDLVEIANKNEVEIQHDDIKKVIAEKLVDAGVIMDA